jgi:DNA modification methylase
VSAARKPALYGDVRRWGLVHADALTLLAKLPAASADAIVCDPPYGIGFLRNGWDGADIRRAANQGGEHLGAAEAFQHWTTRWAVECRRVLRPGGHLLASGAPRTFHRLTSGLEDAGFEIRDQLMWLYRQGMPKSRRLPAGLGTTLKPAFEPIVLARAPLQGKLASNLERFGTGALNIDATRIESGASLGYWPANVVTSHTEDCREGRCADGCPASVLDSPAHPDRRRLLFCAKASRREREAGCEHLPTRSVQLYTGSGRPARVRSNIHPTVKPIELMRWLVRLTCPPGGTVLDPFAGSASTGVAALLEGRQFFGIERESEYVNVARARLEHWERVAAGSAR